MGLFHKSAEKEKLEALEKVISKTNRGIFKRIDENRELLELLYEKAPELMDKCFWIRCWIESQDEFLSKLAEISGVENRTYNLTPDKPYPRPFPKKPDCLTDSFSCELNNVDSCVPDSEEIKVLMAEIGSVK
ncbi:TPA: hypothetical protein JLE25_004411 [Escherichia coli]|nr:hypothetical protein [Escherichia coli]